MRLSFCHPLLLSLPCLPSQSNGQEPTGKCKAHLNLGTGTTTDPCRTPAAPTDTSSSREQIPSDLAAPKSGFNQKPAADHAMALHSPRNARAHGLTEPLPRSSTSQELQPGRQPAIYICSCAQDPLAPGLCVTEPSQPLSLPPCLPRRLPAVNTAGCPGHSCFCGFVILSAKELHVSFGSRPQMKGFG